MAGPGVIVRIGRDDDLEPAIAVYLASNDVRRGGPTPPHHIDRVRDSMGKPDVMLLIAEDAGVCVGMGLAMQSRADGGSGPPEPGVCFISMIFVAPDRWGEGIGGRLVDAVLAEAESQGFVTARLWTHLDNERAQRLYEYRGFHRTGREIDNDLGERIVQYERAVCS